MELLILGWKDGAAFKNDNGWPRKAFEIRLIEFTSVRGKALKQLVKLLINKETPIRFEVTKPEGVLRFVDFLEINGATVELIG